MPPPNALRRINALAIFAAVLLALGIAAILVLDRIGAPGRLVRTIGPVATLVGLVAFGLGARSADLASFLAARRSVPPFHGGLALTAAVAGMALCLYPGLGWSSDPPPLGVAGGIALGAIVLGPLLRWFGATSHNDVVATRFFGSPAHVVSGIVAWTTAALTVFAGFQTAVTATAKFAMMDRSWAEAIVAATLVLTAAPGGLAGVIWCAAASAGEVALIVVFGAAASPQGTSFSPPPALDPTFFDLIGSAPLAPSVAAALAVGGFFVLQPQAIASRDAGSAAWAGVIGAALSLALAPLALVAFSAFPAALGGPDGSHAVADSLLGAAVLASALALARAGVHASSRALGLALGKGRRAFPTPASVRLARMRLAQIALIVFCAISDSKGALDARTALVLAMALSLAMTTPMIALAAIARVGPLSASGAVLAVLAVLTVGVVRAMRAGGPPNAAEAFETALLAAGAGFFAGALASIKAPRRAAPPTPARSILTGTRQADSRSKSRASS